MTTALITGATAGIGAEFARQLAARGFSLVLVARDAQRLAERAAEFTVHTETIAADLSTSDGVTLIAERLGRGDIDWLVNNAGFGLVPPFDENTIEAEQQHLDLLVTAPMRLSHAALRAMLPRHSGTIVNVSSVAAYTPRGTYGAAKSWVLSFSRWANIHYRSRGITVTALAPGFVHTEFHRRMNVDKSTVPSFMWLTADHLVRVALRDIDRGRAVSIPSFRYKFVVWLTTWMPAPIIARGALRGR